MEKEMNNWKYIECWEDLPKENEYVLVKFDDNFTSIMRFIDGEWEKTGKMRQPIYKNKEKLWTSCDPQWWKPLL